MKPRLYLDDCIYSKRLRRMLKNAGYEVQTPAGAGIAGYNDLSHFRYAQGHGFTIVTKDADDFERLHQKQCRSDLLSDQAAVSKTALHSPSPPDY